MKVIYSTQSKSDLLEIAEWISEDNVSAAKRTVTTLQARCRDLQRHPLRFPLLDSNSASAGAS
jgi:plasmid stabilization system protein ParE